jgi:hypothetical protein
MGTRGSIAGNLFAGDKGKVEMGGYLHMGPFILALDSFYGLTGNFLYPIICFEVISCSAMSSFMVCEYLMYFT